MIAYHTCPLASEEGKESGGMNVYVLELAKKLASAGNHVDIFTRSTDPHNTPVVQVADRLRVIHVVAGPQKSIAKKDLLPYIEEFAAEFDTFSKDHAVNYDIMHVHYFLSGLIAQEIQKNKTYARIPVIISFHTLALMKNLVARDTAEKEDDSRVLAESQLCQNMNHIIATSQSDKSYLQYLYDAEESHITVIPPGVNTELFRPIDQLEARAHIGIEGQQKMILFVGRIEPLKGIDMLMYAMKIVTKRNPNSPVCLCVVGGDISQPPIAWPSTLRSLDAIRHILHMSASVKFVGKQKQEELPYFYNAAEMVVMPSHYESFGMAALESMSCGVPVITTNAAGVSSLIDEKHSSLITSVNNPLLLASQIETLLHAPEKRSQMGHDIRQNVLDLSWDNIASQIVDVYDTVITR